MIAFNGEPQLSSTTDAVDVVVVPFPRQTLVAPTAVPPLVAVEAQLKLMAAGAIGHGVTNPLGVWQPGRQVGVCERLGVVAVSRLVVLQFLDQMWAEVGSCK